MSLIEIGSIIGINVRTLYRYHKANTLVKYCRDKGLILAEGQHLKSGKGGKRERKFNQDDNY
jgi:hypothetical protein